MSRTLLLAILGSEGRLTVEFSFPFSEWYKSPPRPSGLSSNTTGPVSLSRGDQNRLDTPYSSLERPQDVSSRTRFQPLPFKDSFLLSPNFSPTLDFQRPPEDSGKTAKYTWYSLFPPSSSRHFFWAFFLYFLVSIAGGDQP